MTVRDLVKRLGGGGPVAERCRVTRGAVSHWCVGDAVPREHHITLWAMALAAGIEWTPPGAAAVRDRLRGQSCPAEAA